MWEKNHVTCVQPPNNTQSKSSKGDHGQTTMRKRGECLVWVKKRKSQREAKWTQRKGADRHLKNSASTNTGKEQTDIEKYTKGGVS